MTDIGILSWDITLPRNKVTALEISQISGLNEEQIIKNLGFNTKYVLDAEASIYSLAYKSVSKLLSKSQINSELIDFIIFCNCGINDFQYWSPAAKLQGDIGAKNAFTFDLSNGCNSLSSAMYVAKSLLAKNQYGLVVCSDSISQFIDYTNPSNIPFYSTGDGAASLLMANNQKQNRILAQHLKSMGKYADLCYIQYGGTNAIKNNTHDHTIKLDFDNPDTKFLAESEIANGYCEVINQALKISGLTCSNVKYIFTNQHSCNIINCIFEMLDIPKTKTINSCLEHGHITSIDPIIGLDIAMKNKTLNRGDIIVLASAGVSFHWGAQVIQI